MLKRIAAGEPRATRRRQRVLFVVPALGLLAAVLALGGAATAAERPPIAFDGAIELKGTHGYVALGLVASTGTVGSVDFFVGGPHGQSIYSAKGTATANSVDVDLGRLGRVDVEVRPTGGTETLPSGCGGKGKATEVPANELVGTIEFHGEEGFTDIEASATPLLIAPIAELPCGSSLGTTTISGSHVPGLLLTARGPDGPSLVIQQNHPGARVYYQAKEHQKEGRVNVSRTVSGRLGAGAVRYAPSLASASFSAASPFSGRATYAERTPAGEVRRGRGTWRGSLRVDFVGDPDVPVAGPGFEASITHAQRSEKVERAR
jgi:hypothetical protein